MTGEKRENNIGENEMKKTTNKARKNILAFVPITIMAVLICVAWLALRARDDAGQPAGINHNNQVGHNAYDSIAPEDIQQVMSTGDFDWDLSDPHYFYKKYPIVALVSISSIDGGRSYSPIFGEYIYAHTYGSMSVKEVYKGDIKTGQTLRYSRLGGIITYEDYYKSMNKEQQEKHDYYMKGQKPERQYIRMKFENDIDIEVGKIYIVFMERLTSKDGKYEEYGIEGLQYGLREARGYNNKSDSAVTILNNETGKWEELNRFIPIK